MSKRKRSSEPESGDPSLYQNVISLDKSPEQSVKLLNSVYELLGLDVQELEARLRDESFSSIPDARPSAKWALRWLLKKLAIRDESGLNLGLDYRTWLLALQLIRSLPYHVISLLIRTNDFLGSIRSVLEKISNDGPAMHTKFSKILLSASETTAKGDGKPTTSKKRKRKPEDDDTSTSVDPAKCFYYVSRVLGALQQGPCHAGNDVILISERQAYLEADLETVTAILSSGLQTFRQIAEASGRQRIHTLFQPDLCESLIRLQDQALIGAPFDNDHQQIPLQDCVGEALQLLSVLRDASVQSDPQSELERELQDVVAQLWIHPFRESHLAKAATSNSETDGYASTNLTQISGSLPLAFDIAFSCITRDTALQRSKEDGWLQKLFSLFYHAVLGLPGDAGTPLTKELVQIANQRHFRLSAKAVADILLFDQQPSSATTTTEPTSVPVSSRQPTSSHVAHDYSHLDWEIVGLLLRNHPHFFATHPDATMAILGQASRLVDPDKVKLTQGSDAGTYELVIRTVILPLVDALSTFLDLERFLSTWSQWYSHGPHELSPGGSDSSPGIYLSESVIWTDERVLKALSGRMSAVLSPSQRVTMLEQWAHDLKPKKADPSVSIKAVTAMILVHCLVASANTEDATKAIVESKVPVKMSERLQKWIVNEKKTKGLSVTDVPVLKWRAWRILSVLLGLGLTNGPGETPAKAVDIARVASERVCEQFQLTNQTGLNEGTFAWVYLIRFVLGIDPGSKKKDSKELLQVPLGMFQKVKLQESDTPSAATNFHVQVSNRFDLALACLVSAVEIFNGSPWIQVLFTQGILALVHQNATHEVTSSEFEDISMTWRRLWQRLNQIAAAATHESSLRHRITEQHVAAFSSYQEPKKQSRLRFELTLDDASSSEAFTPTKKDRSSVAEVLSQWIDSKVLKSDDSKTLLVKTQEFRRLLIGEMTTSEETEPSVAAGIDGGESGDTADVDSIVEHLRRLESHESSIADFDAVMQRAGKMRLQLHAAGQKDPANLQAKTIFWTTLRLLNACKTTATFAACARTMFILVKSKSLNLIGQPHVDELFAMIRDTTSTDRKLDSRAPGLVYSLLCKIFGLLLSDHRHRINGRYHLIVSALQGLLWCLFKPQVATEQPGWLGNNASTLFPPCAEQFSRLLTSLSDPSISAARIGSKKSNLNDPTKKARSIAGQHLSQLVISFCSFQLRGSLEPQLRAKINPGLYAIMGAMSQDVMQNAQASMGASERAVFKVFYDEWRKFGKWKGG